MKAIVVCVVAMSFLCPPAVFAASEEGTPFQQSIARAVAAVALQPDSGSTGGNGYRTPALVMIAAGSAVAIMGSTMPQLRTQTDDYDLCAAANGGPTGPSTRVPACDNYRTANKGLVWTGAVVAAAGLSLAVVGALKDVTVQVRPRGAFIGKTKRF